MSGGVMQEGWSVALAVLMWLVGLVLSAAVLLGLGATGLWFLKKTVGEHNYASVTLLIAVLGGVYGIYQGSKASSEKADQQARNLAFAKSLTQDLLLLATSEDLDGGKKQALERVAPQYLALKAARVNAISVALNSFDVKDLPSARCMDALVRARGGAASMAGRINFGLQRNEEVDFDRDIVELGNAAIIFDAEIKRLYPIYKVGNLAFGKFPEQR